MRLKTAHTYYLITAITTLATSIIWGINTIFLLDAGLNNAEAFGANAVFALAQVIFEIPTGIVADTQGRARSFMYGTLMLSAATLMYVLMYVVRAPFGWWAVASALLGLGYTFFSGATEAWLVDALNSEGQGQALSRVLGMNQAISGVAMLSGSVLGGVLAQLFGFVLPYLVRSALLVAAFVVAWRFMRDLGFTPEANARLIPYTRRIIGSVRQTLGHNRNIGLLMLSGGLTMGVFGYAFYALQPYLLQLSDSGNLVLAGASASLMAVAQVVGGTLSARFGSPFRNPKHSLVFVVGMSITLLILVGAVGQLWMVLGLFCVWAASFAFAMPARQSLLNRYLPSQERATLLSVDNLGGSLVGSIANPLLGRVADVSGYGVSFMAAGAAQLLALPFILMLNITPTADQPDAANESAPPTMGG
jgi:MFS family permease